LRGDANSDGSSNIGDVVFLLGFILQGCTLVPDCYKTADVNDDGDIDVSDPIALLLLLFPLDWPGEGDLPGCGLDLTPDALACDSYLGCQ
jgi:hypothetical protein